jgi:hypothetical protein
MSSLVHQGGSVKSEVKAAHGIDLGVRATRAADGDVGVGCGAGRSVGAVCGVGVGVVRGAG